MLENLQPHSPSVQEYQGVFDLESTSIFDEHLSVEKPEAVVVFDLDSNLINEESLNEILALALADSGKDENEMQAIMHAVEQATLAGMRDGMPLKETIPMRINLLKEHGVIVTQEHFKQIAERCRAVLIEGVREEIADLKEKFGERIKMLIVSGGPQECVEAVADELSIDQFKGNKIVVNEAGECDVEKSEIESEKINPIFDLLEQEDQEVDPSSIIMVGDGGTDRGVWEKELAGHFVGNVAVVGKEARPNLLQDKDLENPTYAVGETISEVFAWIRHYVEEILQQERKHDEILLPL